MLARSIGVAVPARHHVEEIFYVKIKLSMMAHSQISLLAASVGILVAGGSVFDPGVPPTKRVNWQVRFLRSRITSSPRQQLHLAYCLACSNLMASLSFVTVAYQ